MQGKLNGKTLNASLTFCIHLKELHTIDILSLTPEALAKVMADLSHPSYRAEQIFRWLHQTHVTSFADMKNIPKSLQESLAKKFHIPTVEPVGKQVSIKDGTVKYLFGFDDNTTLIESVLMQYNHGYSLCISTQAGCRMGCTFCASAETGLVRHLTAGEMLAQVYGTNKDCGKVSNIVLMGCGEPLDNYDETIRFLHLVNHPKGLNIGQRHITLSTCGLVPEIYKLANLKPQFNLAISLHAPTDEIRKILMPIAKAYPITDLIKACRHYSEATHRRITFEYALAKGVNDSALQAKELSRLLKGLNCHVNIIPINKASGGFTPTPRQNIEAFANILKENNIQTTIRRSLGSDVAAACGQLRAKHIQKQITHNSISSPPHQYP